jgi:hypothetical protein
MTRWLVLQIPQIRPLAVRRKYIRVTAAATTTTPTKKHPMTKWKKKKI